MRIVFLGTGEFAVSILKALAKSDDFLIDLVVSEPAKISGRKKELTSSPIGLAAEELKLKLFTPQTLKDTEVQREILSSKPDLIVTVAYGKIIPKEIFDIPPFKTVNVHPSLLPKYRGASPIQYALMQGEEETGTSLILIDEELDNGAILSQEKIEIDTKDTYDDLEPKLSDLSAKMITRDLPLYISGEIKAKEQNHSEASYTEKIKKEDGEIDWNVSSVEIYNKWRAYYRWPGVFANTQDNKRLNLKEISIIKKEVREVGLLYSEENKLFVASRDGAVEILQIQPEGKKVMEAKEFINGYKQLLDKKLN